MNKLVAINIVLLAIGASNLSFGMIVKYGSIRPSFQTSPTDQRWKTARHDALQGARADIRHTQIINKEKKLFDNALKISDKFTDLTANERRNIDEQQAEREELFLLLPPKKAMKRISEEFIVMEQKLDVAEQQEIRKILNKKGFSSQDQQEYFNYFNICKKLVTAQMKIKKDPEKAVVDPALIPIWINAVKLATELNELEISSIELGMTDNPSAFGASSIAPAGELFDVIQTKDSFMIDRFVNGDFRKIVKLSARANQLYKKNEDLDASAKYTRDMCLQHTAYHEVAHIARAHSFYLVDNDENTKAIERSADVYCALKSEKAAECGRWIGTHEQNMSSVSSHNCVLDPGSYPYLAVAHTNWKVLNLLKAKQKSKEAQRLAADDKLLDSCFDEFMGS